MSSIYLPQNHKTYAKRVVAIGLVVTVGFGIICAYVLKTMAARDYEQAKLTALNITASVNSDVERTFELYDLSLQAVADGLNVPDLWQLPPQIRQLLLFDRAATAKHLGAIVVLDKQGDVILNSRDMNPVHENKSANEFFKAHQHSIDIGTYVGPPSVTRGGEHVLYISRRVNARDGSFNGVVVGSVELSLFHDLFRGLSVGPHDALSMILRPGIIVMRSPFDVSVIGRDVRNFSLLQKMLETSHGSFEAIATIDQVKRLYVYRQVRNAPLIMSYGQSVDAIYAGWWHDAFMVGAIVALLCGSNIALVVFLSRTLKRRSEAEHKSNIAASIDGLTGLFNRRLFEDVSRKQWLAAQKDGSVISVLMIDADRFKSFNDEFGHQAGDHALQNIAGCIQQAATRSVDFCARYGGEEFAVVLPGYDSEQALAFAERIRTNIHNLRDREDRPDRTPTVSIGAASIEAVEGLDMGDLIQASDAALYRAKVTGRDRAVFAALPRLVSEQQTGHREAVASL